MKFRELEVNMCTQMNLLLTNVEEKIAKNGGKFLTLTFADGEQAMSGNKWNETKESFPFAPGEVLLVTIETQEYNGKLSMTVKECAPSSLNPLDFMLKAPIPAEKMYDDILSFSQKLGDYSAITTYLLEENKEKLLRWGAGKRIHHNVIGGLLYHMYRMLQIATRIVQIYTIDRDLMLAGTILHDIGKVKELECGSLGEIEYSVDGTLFGHLYLGAEMVEEAARKIGQTDLSKVRLLKHMIVSHHGKLEYGAVALPSIPEAALLHHIDCIDAEFYQFEQTRNTMESDSLSERIFGLGTRVYNP